jgi:hypothetical protein
MPDNLWRQSQFHSARTGFTSTCTANNEDNAHGPTQRNVLARLVDGRHRPVASHSLKLVAQWRHMFRPKRLRRTPEDLVSRGTSRSVQTSTWAWADGQSVCLCAGLARRSHWQSKGVRTICSSAWCVYNVWADSGYRQGRLSLQTAR